MPRQFIIFDEEDMKMLSEGLLVHQDADDDLPDLYFCTEKGYQKILEFWDEEDE